MFTDPKCLTVNHNVQRATEGKAAGRTFSTDSAFGGGVALDTAPLSAPGQGLPERKSGNEGTGAARFAQ